VTNSHINKAAAAQRQLDAAIRMLFLEEDILAIHTVAAAARRIVADLINRRGLSIADEMYSRAVRTTIQELSGKTPSDEEIVRQLPKWKRFIEEHRNKSANFLKHADRDHKALLNESDLETDDLLLEACHLYSELGFELTTEMKAFRRWHLAVYPHEPGDELLLPTGPIHSLPRDEQLEFGAWLLETYHKN